MIGLGIAVLIVLACVLLVGIGWGGVLLLVQLGIIANEARKPQHIDNYDYRLTQGREIGRNDQQHESADNESQMA